MTIEQKAKAYDEALKVLHKYDGANIMFSQSLKEEMFPELKESEDEKVRKELISLVKETKVTVRYYDLNKMLAWLEKQGDHANFLSRIQVGDKVTRNEDGVLVNLSQLKRVAKKDEKQGEQKPWSEKYIADVFEKVGLAKIVREQSNDNLTNALQDAMIELSKFIPQPNPAWSEEDERLCQCIIEDQEEALNKVSNDKYGHSEIISDLEEMYRERIAFLKSLKDRVQPQPKQEWSKEDELHIRELESLVKQEWAIAECENDKDKIHKMSDLSFFLKTLKPQLKQDEQKLNPVLDVEIPFGSKDSELQEASYYIPEGFHAEIDNNRVVIKRGKQKPAWNEEDEERLQSCLNVLQAKGLMGVTDTTNTKWLKSLKDKVQSQSKHKQEETILHWENGHPKPYKSVFILRRHGNVVVEGEWSEKTGMWYQYGFQSYLEDNEVAGWMNKKSLLCNFYSCWKPSDAQMASITCAVRKMKESACYDSELVSLFNDLKKLREE